ncbi:MAG TPA: HAD family hydrolase [Gemmatimonadales bacterium]|nr:HAD family hydrolase [Gemmatimonadales bacterium]
MRRLVLFDIDGTMLLTAGAGRRAITRALAGVVDDVTAFERVRFDGKTDPQIVGELLEAAGHPDPREPATVRALCRDYVGLLERELARNPGRTRVLPGIRELLDQLDAEPGVLLGLLTGNLCRGARLKLRAAGIDPARFVIGAYGCDSPHRPDLPAVAARRAEPHFGRLPAGHEVVIIGDTPADVTCGRGIGARAIGVATGSYSVDDLLAAGAHAAFTDLGDTTRVVRAILD